MDQTDWIKAVQILLDVLTMKQGLVPRQPENDENTTEMNKK